MRLSLGFLFLMWAFAGAAEKENKLFDVHDLIAMTRLQSTAVSPDGLSLVYTTRAFDEKAGKSTVSMVLLSSQLAKANTLIATTEESFSSFAWAPDSKDFAYVSNKGGKNEIWLMNVARKKAYKISDFPVDVSNIKWSPTGDFIAFSAEVYIDAATLKETAQRDNQKNADKSNVMTFDSLMIRHWDSWHNKKRSHIFVQKIQKDKQSWILEGSPIDLMEGIDGDSPLKPFGDTADFDWSSDGKEIAYTMHAGRDYAWTTDSNIYVVGLHDKQTKCLTCENKASDTHPSYSPDGNYIAYLAMSRPGFEADKTQLKIFHRATKKITTMYENWDFSPDDILWAKDSKSVFFTANQHARKKIFVGDISGHGAPKELVNERSSSLIGISFGNMLLFKWESMKSPADVHSIRSDGTDINQVTHLNPGAFGVLWSHAEEFYFEGAQKEKVQGWILRPADFKSGKKYPIAFLIHGGPQSAFGDNFSYRWNPQVFAGAGYGVIMINFHGSTGFGQAFTDSISGDWGGKPYEDLLKGLDFAISNYSWVDESRMCALGASYGGYMVNWINGHTNRFKCLVNHAGIFDTKNLYFSTEELWFPEWDFNGTPMQNAQLYDLHSPARFVKDWKTPTLVIHGGKDFRVVDTEGISTFTALQRMGIPSKLVYFPKENHWVLNPYNSIVWHDEVLSWLDSWLK